ncbi:hypothetical protein TNCV_5041871 [Trichonephila clavipes]|nr:hypothetical protein TNCV_5041871 [Trichonephila clavipes]
MSVGRVSAPESFGRKRWNSREFSEHADDSPDRRKGGHQSPQSDRPRRHTMGHCYVYYGLQSYWCCRLETKQWTMTPKPRALSPTDTRATCSNLSNKTCIEECGSYQCVVITVLCGNWVKAEVSLSSLSVALLRTVKKPINRIN